MAIKEAKLTFGGSKKNWEYKSSRGRKKPIRKTNKQKWQPFFSFLFFGDSKILYFVWALFEFSGQAPFKLVTPLN